MPQKQKNCLVLTIIAKLWTSLKISWHKGYIVSNSFWVTIKKDWLSDLQCANLNACNTNPEEVIQFVKVVLAHSGKKMCKGFKVCTEIYLQMYPEEFIYLPLYNICNNTFDLDPVLHPWCRNLIIADIIKENRDFRNKGETTLCTCAIEDYELKLSLKKELK